MSNLSKGAAITLVALAAIAVSAPPSSADPLLTKAQIADVARSIEACLNLELSSEKISSPTQCIGRTAGKCDDEITAGGEAAHATCADNETAGWDIVLNKTWGQLSKALPGEQFAALQESQRAWLAFRDKRCAFLAVIDSTMMGYMNAAHCRLDEIARRTIELREFLPE